MKASLSPKELALAIGVSESSLKRWADDGLLHVARTAGGHRRIPLQEAVRFVRTGQYPVMRPDLLGLPNAAPIQPQQGESSPAVADTLFDAFNRGDSQAVRGVILGQYLAGTAVTALFDGPVRKAMCRLGELWEHSDRGIFIEHRATDLCLGTIHQLRQLLPPRPADAPLALGGAPSGDPYMLTSLMAAVTLAEQGYQEMNLGPQTPARVVLDAAGQHRPQLVWMSVSHCDDARALRDELETLAAGLAALQVPLALGGRALGPLLPLASPHPHICRSMAELSAFARGVRQQMPIPSA